jgi:hypothetical protein
MRCRSECGQLTVMIVGFFIVVGLLTAVVIDASVAYLRNQSLNSLADGAALAAVDGIEGEQVYSGDLGRRAEIDPELAERYVREYMAAIGATDDYPGLDWHVRPSGEEVVVEVWAPVSLPITPPGWNESTIVTGEAAAVVPVN